MKKSQSTRDDKTIIDIVFPDCKGKFINYMRAVMPNEIIIKKVTDFISASILFIYFSTKGCDNIGCRNTIRSTRYKRLS